MSSDRFLAAAIGRPAIATAAASATAGAPVVTLDGVTKRFRNGTLALDHFDLTVHSGEFLSLLGPSGCGKSTALRLIAGLGEPTAGRIAWGQDGSAARPARQRDGHDVGFVFQEPTLMPWATVLRNVMLPLELEGVVREVAPRRAAEALEWVGLAAFQNAYPRELSGGMKMRVSIARALVTDPPLLLMDEPFAALDEITRFKLNNDLLALWQAVGHTAIFVTHSVFESVYLSRRIVVMTPRPGRVFAEIAIDAPYPRDESFRTSAAYARLCRTVSQALENAMAGAGGIPGGDA
jgi:NitT/TauT family transport system ATP-binding protein